MVPNLHRPIMVKDLTLFDKPLTKSDILNKLFKDYGLFYDGNPDNKDNDIFKHKHYKIITRSGIEKIQKAAGIEISYKLAGCSDTFAIVHATGRRFNDDGSEMDGSPLETFGSANLENSPNSYYAEVAEKRAMSRIVLKLAGMYEYGVMGQDELKETSGGSSEVKTAEYKP